ncbi:hypothetical+protein [Methylocapsa aurea]|jgi:hypothetical protein
MNILPRPYPSLPARSARRAVAVAAPADLRGLRLEGRRKRPRAVWAIDPASRRPVCLWDAQTDALGRAEDEDAQSRPRRSRVSSRADRRATPRAFGREPPSSKSHAAALYSLGSYVFRFRAYDKKL